MIQDDRLSPQRTGIVVEWCWDQVEHGIIEFAVFFREGMRPKADDLRRLLRSIPVEPGARIRICGASKAGDTIAIYVLGRDGIEEVIEEILAEPYISESLDKATVCA